MGGSGPNLIGLRSDGTVVTNRYLNNTPKDLTGIIQVAASSYCYLALRGNGEVVRWSESSNTTCPLDPAWQLSETEADFNKK